MSTRGKSTITSSDRTRTEIKKEIKSNTSCNLTTIKILRKKIHIPQKIIKFKTKN